MDFTKHYERITKGFRALTGGAVEPTPTPAPVVPANVIAARYAVAADVPPGAAPYASSPLAISGAATQPSAIVAPAPLTSQRTNVLENQLNQLQAKMTARAVDNPALNVLERKQQLAVIGMSR